MILMILFVGLLCLFGLGVTSFLLGILAIIFPPFDVLMNERLRMIRGFPAFEWWKEPPDEVLMRLYIFNITNKLEFLAGKEKLKLEEIGPWVFREKLEHKNVHFNSNGTMSYTASRSVEFLPHLSGNLSMETRLVLPNLGVLGIASYLWDASFFTKLGFNMLMLQYNSEPIVEMSAKDYMWNNSDPLFKMAGKLMPDLVPTTNLGVLHIIYEHFSDEVTVYMGVENSHRFFLIDQFRGSPRLHYWEDERCDLAAGASEGVSYPQFLTRNDSILYLRKTICRATPLYYVKDTERYGMKGYRFELPDDIFASEDPDRDKHGSYVIVEPLTGVPMESRARSQSNLVVRPLRGINRVQAFSDLTVPMFWAEYNQVGLPWYISWLMYFVVEIVPPTQQPVAFCMVTAGISILLASLLGLTCARHYRHPHSPVNSTPTSRSYSSLNLITASSAASTKSASLSA
ncbi:hypothetical protein B566_EDAN012497 [Ephemera danica]|nr:hypothetical protein B566_EDAN012497 [Ephemera danica]